MRQFFAQMLLLVAVTWHLCLQQAAGHGEQYKLEVGGVTRQDIRRAAQEWKGPKPEAPQTYKIYFALERLTPVLLYVFPTVTQSLLRVIEVWCCYCCCRVLPGVLLDPPSRNWKAYLNRQSDTVHELNAGGTGEETANLLAACWLLIRTVPRRRPLTAAVAAAAAGSRLPLLRHKCPAAITQADSCATCNTAVD